MKQIKNITKLLQNIYGEQKSAKALKLIIPMLKKFHEKKKKKTELFSQEDVILITYGDTLNRSGEAPLSILSGFADQYLKDIFSIIHLLPFYPFSSDDGFSVIDYMQVDPKLGSWDNIKSLGANFDIMFDHVLNHISAQSGWVQNYLEEKDGYQDLAIEVDPGADLSAVTRPRSLPLLTEFKKKSGAAVHLWTTFSADQIDLNYKSLFVLKKIIQIFLFYIEHGARIIRLDAIAYLWKKVGTPCIHMPGTHAMVKLFRAIFDIVAPDVIILTETNVPHAENISYFGNGQDEAQMVYNFTLPPLLLHTVVKEDSRALSAWARKLRLPSKTNTFLNFTASHDGIGVRPLEGILPKKDIDELIAMVRANHGNVSMKQNADGSESPYEMNITYLDACRKPSIKDDYLHPRRFLATQAIQYALPGVPATYIHSLLGSRNWLEGVKQTKRYRTINREKLQADNLEAQLDEHNSFRSKIFYPYIEMIKLRRRQKAFHPNADFKILDLSAKTFAIQRECKEQTIFAITNISSDTVSVAINKDAPSEMSDIFTGRIISKNAVKLNPYQTVWLDTKL